MNLPDLCRYYLRCLSVAYQDGVVVGQNSATDYIELPTHPAIEPRCCNLLVCPDAATMANRARSGFLKRTGNVFNVAVTRARAGLIVVGDKSAARNSQVGHLARLADYIQRLAVRSSSSARTSPLPLKFDSIWEERFYSALEDADIATIPQYNVEKYILDFALFDGGRRLNIEIDGERYHRDWNGELLRRDQLRNARLRELGWEVMRFWVYEVRDEMDHCIGRVRKWLEAESDAD